MRKEKPPVPKAARQDNEVSGTRLKQDADQTMELREEDIEDAMDVATEQSGTRRISPDWQKKPLNERLSKALDTLEANDKKLLTVYKNNLLSMQAARKEQTALEEQKEKTGDAASYTKKIAELTKALEQRMTILNNLKNEAHAAQDRFNQYKRIREELKKGTGLNFNEKEFAFYESLAPLLLRQANRLAKSAELTAQQEVENLKDLAMRVSLPVETYTFEDADATGKYQAINASQEEMPTEKYQAVSIDADRTGQYNALDEMRTDKYQALRTNVPQKPAIGPPEEEKYRAALEAKRNRPAIGAPEEEKYLARFKALEKANKSKLELVKGFKSYYEPRIAKLEKDLLYYREEAIKQYQRQAEQFSTGDKEALSRSSKADELAAEKIRSLTVELNQTKDQLENLKALERHMKLNTPLTDYQQKLYEQLAA